MPQKSSTQRNPPFNRYSRRPSRFLRRKADRADVGGHRERALEQLIVGEPDHPVVRVAFVIAADRRLGQLGHRVMRLMPAYGIVGRPALAHVLPADARVLNFADREGAVFEMFWLDSAAEPLALPASGRTGPTAAATASCGHEVATANEEDRIARSACATATRLMGRRRV